MSFRKYNMVIFGATGTTGEFMILEIVRFLESAPPDQQFSWAVAGRTISKLEDVLREASKTLRKDLSNVDKIVADVSNPKTLRDMAKQCDVVLNFVGPYLLYGEPVIRACIEEGTHHLDLSAEDQFLEEMQIKYHDEAKKTGSLILGAVGYGSIPADYGSSYLEEHFDGELNSVESYIQVMSGRKTPEVHYGTWTSIMLMFHRFSELKLLRSRLYDKPYVNFKYELGVKSIRYKKSLRSWCINVPIPDAGTMERTQKYKYFELNRRPAQTKVYLQIPNLLVALLVWIAIQFVLVFARYKFVYHILTKYPRLVTLGVVTPEGQKDSNNFMPFKFTLIGKGWDYTAEQVSGLYVNPPNKTVVLKVSGINAAHEGTVIPMLQAGLTVLKERGRMPLSGGVYTPGIAFAGTSLAERLTQQGITFTLQSCKEFENNEKIV